MGPRASTPGSPRRSGPGLRAVQPQGRRRDMAPRGLPAPRPPAEARATLVDEVEHDALACLTFPVQTFPIQHRTTWHSTTWHSTTWHSTTWHGTDPPERPSREVTRRADVVGIAPRRPPRAASSGSSAPCRSRPTTSGRPSTATCRSKAWPSSTRRPSTSPPPTHGGRHHRGRMTVAAPSTPETYTTSTDAAQPRCQASRQTGPEAT